GAARWAKPLHGLLGALERRWPTDPLTAYRRAAATGAELPGLALHLGASWQESGHPREALDALVAARAELEATWAPRLAKAPEADRAAAQAELESGEDACLARLY
ncbi:MAG TPA: hypothetical protein DCZ72_01025, partial [Armatimonadetes bacterium]|nr:hypothetical protein [Armatimonadota bacterium]